MNYTDGNYSNRTGNVTWSFDGINLPPLVNIIDPSNEDNISIPHNMTFTTVDPNNDDLNVTIFNGSDVYVTSLDQNDTWYNLVGLPNGLTNITLQACELGTSELYCINDTHLVNVTSCTPSLVNTSWTWNNNSCLINDTYNYSGYVIEYDKNLCGGANTTYWNNGTDGSCNYCSYNEYLTGFYPWSNVSDSCGWRARYSWDLNYSTCCQTTNISADCYESDNFTFQGNYTYTNQTSECTDEATDQEEWAEIIAVLIGYILIYLIIYKREEIVGSLFFLAIGATTLLLGSVHRSTSMILIIVPIILFVYHIMKKPVKKGVG